MAKQKSIGGECSAVYKNFGGIDLGAGKDKAEKMSFAYMENMYKDYDGDSPGSIESIPGFRQLYNFQGRINSVFMQKCSENEEYIVVHSGGKLFRFNINERDSLSALLPIASLKDGKSHAFHKGGSLFVSDGEKIIKISSDGTTSILSEESGGAYIPTTFINGEPFEQKNLLTRRFREAFLIRDYDKLYRESPGIEYTVNDDDGTCAVTGIDESFEGELYIPKYACFGEKCYRITEISQEAFYRNNKISALYIADGLTYIGASAFYSCTSLRVVQCPSTIEFIDNGAFEKCTALTDVFIGKNFRKSGPHPFRDTSMLINLNFEFKASVSTSVENFDQLQDFIHVYAVGRPPKHYRIPIFTPLESISRVTVRNEETDSYTFEVSTDNSPSSLYLTLDSIHMPEGDEVILSGLSAAGKYNSFDNGTDFISRSGEDENIIAECRCSAFFDGRIFAAGNPKYPNTVFYTLDGKNEQSDELYFGSLAYFDDGMSAYETVALTPSSDALAVLKARDDGGGGIFYHESKDGGDFLQKVYPVSNIHTGINVKGACVSHFDEIFFLSDIGACSLTKSSAGTRYAACKSEKINPLLLKSRLSDANLCTWRGYIVIQVGKEIYLADARQSASSSADGYDWYYLTGIGVFSDAVPLAKYMSAAPEGFTVHQNPDTYASGTVYSVINSNLEELHYVTDSSNSNVRYAVYLTGEETGGAFSPASCIFSDGNLLFFGTESGALCLFNTDKRGVAPESVRRLADFDADIYGAFMNNKIHPEFYGFAGRAPRYTLVTKAYDGDVPYFKKRSVKNSVCVNFGNIGSLNSCVEIWQDGEQVCKTEGFSSVLPNFSEWNFAAVSFNTSDESPAIICGSPKGWREKEIRISSEEFRSPISISQISYRYKIKGKLTRK